MQQRWEGAKEGEESIKLLVPRRFSEPSKGPGGQRLVVPAQLQDGPGFGFTICQSSQSSAAGNLHMLLRSKLQTGWGTDYLGMSLEIAALSRGRGGKCTLRLL